LALDKQISKSPTRVLKTLIFKL